MKLSEFKNEKQNSQKTSAKSDADLMDKYNELKDIDHVLYVESTKFYNGVLVFPDEFNQNNLKGEVALNVYFSNGWLKPLKI